MRAAMMLAVLLPASVSAQEQGTAGDLTWKVEALGYKVYVSENGNPVEKPACRLTISGNGEMPDYKNVGYDDVNYRNIYDYPWYKFQNIAEDTDAAYFFENAGLKEYLVLNSSHSPHSFCFEAVRG